MVIRQARPEDAEAIARIMIANWRATYAEQLSDDFLASLDPSLEAGRWRERMTRPAIAVRVAATDQVVGFVAAGPTFDRDLDPAASYQIYNLHVAETSRGRGIGKRLLEAAARVGRDLGASELCLWVVPENRRARQFYERAGLANDGTIQREPVGSGATLEEVRYRGPIGPVATG
ncbi:MAG: N-acetyltransferase family protein [Gemmatimonadales bacterium]